MGLPLQTQNIWIYYNLLKAKNCGRKNVVKNMQNINKIMTHIQKIGI